MNEIYIWLSLLAVSWALFGLIWMVQLVHYPSFAFVEVKQFSDFHQHHTDSIVWIVMPLMLLELGLSVLLAYQNSFALSYLFPLGLVLLVWACTFFVSIPLHNSLSATHNIGVMQKLVFTNWPRTILWTIKAIYVSVQFAKIIKLG